MLTPIDIQNHVLKSTMGGYNKKDTDDFIEAVQASYEQLYKENNDLKEKISALSEGLQYYKQMEGTLQKALVLAEKTSTETLEAAKSQASEILESAKAEASQTLTQAQGSAESSLTGAQAQATSLLETAKTTADRLLAETKAKTDQMMTQATEDLKVTTNNVRQMISCYENYRLQFKQMVSNQLSLLDSPEFKIYAPDLDTTLDEQDAIVASNEAAAQERVFQEVPSVDSLELQAASTEEDTSAFVETEPVVEQMTPVLESLEPAQEENATSLDLSLEEPATDEANPFTFIDAK